MIALSSSSLFFRPFGPSGNDDVATLFPEELCTGPDRVAVVVVDVAVVTVGACVEALSTVRLAVVGAAVPDVDVVVLVPVVEVDTGALVGTVVVVVAVAVAGDVTVAAEVGGVTVAAVL